MATKHKRRTKQGAAELLEQARRSLEKGDFKEALKDAKVCHRQQPGPESRRLLERAYLARGRQLHQAGLRAEAQAAAKSLLDLGATDPAVGRELPELLIAVGLFDRAGGGGGRGATLQEDDPLYVVAADHAVIRPEGAPASLPVIRQGAATIRQSLAALERGDEAAAVAALGDIPRASPFADWRYFIRGLAAYYREDAAGMQANWERLDPERFASRIAASLKALAGGASASDPETAERLARLGRGIAGGPVLECPQRLQNYVVAGRWREAVKLLRVFGPRLRQIDPSLSERLGMALYAILIRKGEPGALRELAAAIAPPAIDLHWNRGLAMAWEQCEDGDVSDVEDCWRAYLIDLADLECLSPAERSLAQALVWLRLGEFLLDEARHICPTCGVCHDPDEDAESRAIACFEKSLTLAPDLLKAHQALAKAWEKCGKPERAAAAQRRLIERFPENLDGLRFLTDYHMKRDEPLVARDFLLRARRLKPLDAWIKAKVLVVHLESARHHSLAGRWDEGRAELAAAEEKGVPREEGYCLPVHRAMLEMKAGQGRRAERLLDESRNDLGESAPVWLLAAAESARYALPKAAVGEFEARWIVAMKRNCGGLAVGEMCRIMDDYLQAEVDYSHRNEHVDFLLDCLRRRSRRTWNARDLRGVTDFLMSAATLKRQSAAKASRRHADPDGVMKLLAKYATKARKAFSDNAYFQLLAGETEMHKGPRKCRRKFARTCFQRAVELGEAAGDEESMAWAKRAKEKLLFLDEHAYRPPDDIFLPPDDDFPAEMDDLFEEDAEGEGFSPGEAAGSLFEMFARVCREQGLDPKEVFDGMSGEMPFRFRPEGGPKPSRKKGR